MTFRCGWWGTLHQFLAFPQDLFLTDLKERSVSQNFSVNDAQVTAWSDSLKILQSECSKLYNHIPSAAQWTIIFEYELPRERGRRPDVIILSPLIIYILEFKEYREIHQAHIDQVEAYARDLKNYHAASHHNDIVPILILTKSPSVLTKQENVWITSPDNLSKLVMKIVPHSNQLLIDARQWFAADYRPLPSLIGAARMIFHHEPLPQIRRALSAGIPQTIEELVTIGRRAQDQGELHLAFVTGVPGSGKTLVGIQLVYENNLERGDEEKNAVFLSGNVPLVKVLQHALRSTIFVQDVHGFIKQYGGESTALPMEHIMVYDEAQRAWDSDRVREKRASAYSEPEDFLHLAERMKEWAFMVALIGEGQEIHIGEERGLPLWKEALERMGKDWTIHCSKNIAPFFEGRHRVELHPHLNLTATLRSHLAEDVSQWVEELLNGNISQAHDLSHRIYAQGFDVYLTRDLDVATQYAKERYRWQEEKRYGLMASSKAKNLPNYNVHNEFHFTNKVKPGSWYNDPPSSRFSCCALRDVVTEFGCQGLELDFPIVCWGDDLVWVDSVWRSKKARYGKAHDPHRLRINSYRVLLTRGRDGFIIFVPDESEMDSTYSALLAAGLRELSLLTPVLSVPQNSVSIS